MQKLLLECDDMVHCGKRYEDMSKRHQRRKLADFYSAAEGALWFAVIWPDSRVSTGSYIHILMPTNVRKRPARLYRIYIVYIQPCTCSIQCISLISYVIGSYKWFWGDCECITVR